jgi:Domain of unknown function (DUF4189)
MTHNSCAMLLAAALIFAQSGAAWATGAIAVDDQPGSKPSDAGYGIGFGDTKESAQKAALDKCNGAGNDSCKVIVWFEKCGAYASSNEKYGAGWGATEDDAKAKALDQCGNGQCRVVASDCGD